MTGTAATARKQDNRSQNITGFFCCPGLFKPSTRRNLLSTKSVKHPYMLPKTAHQMKTSRLFLILFTLLFSLSVDANWSKKIISSPKPDTTLCLEVQGKVLNSDQDGSPCKVEVLLGDRVVDSV